MNRLREALVASQNDLEVQKETLRTVITANIQEAMRDDGITREELADRMGRSKAYVTSMLSGDRNFTIDALATVAHHLDRDLHFTLMRPGEFADIRAVEK